MLLSSSSPYTAESELCKALTSITGTTINLRTIWTILEGIFDITFLAIKFYCHMYPEKQSEILMPQLQGNQQVHGGG